MLYHKKVMMWWFVTKLIMFTMATFLTMLTMQWYFIKRWWAMERRNFGKVEIGGIMSRILMPASPRWSRPWDWWPCWPWRYVDPFVSVDHVDSVDHVNSGDYVDHNDHVDHVDHVDYVNYQVDSINHIDHALNFPATANMQREEKKGKERSIYSGELVFEIKNDFVFPCVTKSFSFLLFQSIGRMDSIPMKMIRWTKNINLFQF